MVAGLPCASALVNSQGLSDLWLCQVVVKPAEVIAQLANAGLPDVIDIKIPASSLDGANHCVLAEQQCQLAENVKFQAIAQIHPPGAQGVDLQSRIKFSSIIVRTLMGSAVQGVDNGTLASDLSVKESKGLQR